MQGRDLNVRWTLVIPVLALAAVVLVFLSRGSGAGPHRTIAAARPARESRTLGAREFRALSSRPTAAEESLRAAAAPVKADKLAPATLAESLRAAVALTKAGKLAAPATLAESLQAADTFAKADLIAPSAAPTLAESLQAADILVKAGVIAPPAPALIEILHAAALLSVAKSAPPTQNQPAPPPPTATPVTTTPTTQPRTATPVTKPAGVLHAAGSSAGGWYDDAFTAQILADVNRRRVSAGLQPLAVEPRLANSAATYANVLADTNTFSHTGPDGSTLVTRDEAAGFPFTVQIGEVLAWGSNGWTPAEIVQAWMDSPAHREQIMSAVYTRAGVGCYFTTSGGTPMVRCAMELAGAG